jgi:hypothetical protein
VASIALAQHHRTSGSAGTAPRQRGPDPAGAPLAFERATSVRARPSARRQHCSAQNAGSIHDWVVRRVETARISLKRTPRFHLARRRAQNGACPGYRAILPGECALGALERLFWFPGRFMCIVSRTPAQGAHPSAVETLGVRNADLPGGWSLSRPSRPFMEFTYKGARAAVHGRAFGAGRLVEWRMRRACSPFEAWGAWPRSRFAARSANCLKVAQRRGGAGGEKNCFRLARRLC